MLLKNRIGTILFIATCFAFTTQAQTLHNIAGFVCTRGTSVRLDQVQVTNKRTNETKFTDDQGTFTIKAAIGDTILYSKDQYTTAKLPVLNLQDVVVFMQAVVQLSTVTVKGQTKQQELNSIMNDYAKKGVYYNGKPSVGSAIISPINALYSAFGKEPQNARRFAAYAKTEEAAAQDSRKYNKDIVKKITSLPDDEIEKFMTAYKPSHEDLLKWNEYDVIAYIKKSLEIYKKYGAQDLPKLMP
jgi:hypothetical protein